MEARSGKSGKQSHVSTIGKNVSICISPIQPNTSGIVETKERSDHNDIGGTNKAITSMVFSSSEHVYPQSAFINTLEGPTSGKTHPLVVNRTQDWRPGWFPEIIGIKRHFKQSCKAYTRFQKRKFNLF